jgi:RNA polymerase sigma-70 factor (ECF subfamily)
LVIAGGSRLNTTWMQATAASVAIREAVGPSTWPAHAERLMQMATDHYQFVWRSIRRLGVAEQAADDAAQQVFVRAAEKIVCIVPGCERAFLFQTAVRVAMAVRRTYAQRREAMVGEELDDIVDAAPLPDEAAQTRQFRDYLDQLLDALPMDLRIVFILYEIEGLGSPEIAEMLTIPVGTVASRLRRARAAFGANAARLRKRLERRAT